MLPDGTAPDNLTGADLRLLRLSRRIRLSTLARRYGVSRTRLAVIEGQIEPPPTSRAAGRYLAALRDAVETR
jgi:transcriptional regulator with XRE-family HTH domain